MNQNDYREQLVERLETKARCETDLIFRKEVLDRCYEDSVYWCNNFAFTFDPRQEFYSQRNLPFILYPKQIEMVRFVEGLLKNSEDGVIEKSRDVGASYTLLVPVILYQWLFHDFNAKIGSRKESYVDKSDDPDALFWKIDYNIRKLPKYLLPDGFDLNIHRTYMRLSRPDNNNTITGESANDSFARAGRNNLTLFDELGFWPYAKSSWEAAGESTTTRLAISTPSPAGKSSFFYKLINSGRAKKFTFHYTQDIRKNDAWVEKQRAKKSGEEFERELNISYQGSSENTVYLTAFKQVPIGKYTYEPRFPIFVSWDFGLDGVAIQWYQWNRSIDKWYLIDSYFNSDRDIGFYIPFITGRVKSGYSYEPEELDMIRKHGEWQIGTHFGDPDVKKRGLQAVGAVSTQSILQQEGIYVQTKSWAGRTHYDLRQKALMFMRKLYVDEENNEFFIDCINSARYPERTETNQATTPIMNPIHNFSSHHRSAFEYMADNAPERVQEESIDWKNVPKLNKYKPNS